MLQPSIRLCFHPFITEALRSHNTCIVLFSTFYSWSKYALKKVEINSYSFSFIDVFHYSILWLITCSLTLKLIKHSWFSRLIKVESASEKIRFSDFMLLFLSYSFCNNDLVMVIPHTYSIFISGINAFF